MCAGREKQLIEKSREQSLVSKSAAKPSSNGDGFSGCEPASATTVAGLKRLVADGFVKSDEETVAVLTGHVLKDADYVINYHRQTLFAHHTLPDETEEEHHLTSTFSNPPARVDATKEAILEELAKRESRHV